MLGDEPAAARADVMQAEYFRDFLDQERSELAVRLASHTRGLTECMTGGDMSLISHVRHAIRRTQRELHAIDRMLYALNGRFPEESDLRSRA
jgi:hypothetical protein